jgi:hypothetical protein
MKKKGILISLLTLIVTLVAGICVRVVEAQEQTAQSPFATTYELGTTLNPYA